MNGCDHVTDIDAFIAGLKPALIVTKTHPEITRLKRYPHVELPKVIAFFPSIAMCREFSAKINGVDIPSREYHYQLGLVSGFPPIAVEFFCNFCEDNSLEVQGAMFEYAGRYFFGRYDDAKAIATWLWSQVPISPTEVKIDYHGRKLSLFPPNDTRA